MKYLLIILVLITPLLAFAAPYGPQVGSGPTSANLWVDTNGGTCTRQSTAGAYVDAQACSSMQTALTAASAGDIIVIRNGTYAAQNVTTNGKASTVNFYAQTYGSVLTPQLAISVNNVSVYGVIASGSLAIANDNRELDVSGSNILIDGFVGRTGGIGGTIDHVTVQHCEFGNYDTALTAGEIDSLVFAGPVSYIYMLNNYFHDYYNHTGSNDRTYHNDMVSFKWDTGGDHITFDGNVFNMWPNEGSAIMSSGPLSNWTIQNNYFGAIGGVGTCGNNFCYGQGTCTGYLIIRNNVYSADSCGNMANTGGCSPNADVSGNIQLTTFYCSCTLTGTPTGGYNVFASNSANNNCPGNARICTPTWLNGTPSLENGFDIRLSPTDTCAIDHGNTGSYPTTDFYGTARPIGASPDAGAYEYGAGGGDTTAPTVTEFTIPATATSLTVSVSSFTCTDDTAVTGYCVTTTNDSAGCSWAGSAQSTVTFGSAGAQTAYGWCKDAAGNVSDSVSDGVTITLSLSPATATGARIVGGSIH